MAESENGSSESGGFRIDAIWAYLSVDDDGDEGVMAMRGQNDWMPMIAGDERRRDLLRPVAEQQAKVGGVVVKLVRFHQREEVETIE